MTAPSATHPDAAVGAEAGPGTDVREVLFVSLSTELWGAETSILLLARQIAASGRRPRLLTRSPAFAAAWPDARGEYRAGPGFFLRLLTLAWRRQVAAVVCCSLPLIPAFAVLRLLPPGRRPVLALDLHYYLPTPRGRGKVRGLAVVFDRVVTVSRFTARQLGRRRRPVLVLARPVEPPATPAPAQAGPGPVDPPLVGVVGRVDTDKRLELVIGAARLLPDLEFVVRGSSLSSPAYEQGLRTSALRELGPRMRFEGRVPHAQAMAGLACLVVANHEEAMGRTVAEAQLGRVPVVVPDAGGAAEMVHDGLTGVRFAAGCEVALAAAIRRVVDDPATTTGMVERAHRDARSRHDPGRVASRYAGFVLDGRTG